MSEDKKSLKERENEHYAEQWASKNWRAWGSWFSWGSPVGLSIFLLSLTAIVWILAHL